jgi:hypothetical protein
MPSTSSRPNLPTPCRGAGKAGMVLRQTVGKVEWRGTPGTSSGRNLPTPWGGGGGFRNLGKAEGVEGDRARALGQASDAHNGPPPMSEARPAPAKQSMRSKHHERVPEGHHQRVRGTRSALQQQVQLQVEGKNK